MDNLNAQQLAAVRSDAENTLVLSGAGTGKTTVLINRIIYMIQELAIAPNNIVALRLDHP